jgi:hypothetical protein
MCKTSIGSCGYTAAALQLGKAEAARQQARLIMEFNPFACQPERICLAPSSCLSLAEGVAGGAALIWL